MLMNWPTSQARIDAVRSSSTLRAKARSRGGTSATAASV